MIRVDRKRVKVPQVCVGDDSPAAVELMAAERYVAEKPPGVRGEPSGRRGKRKSYPFKVYGHQQIKDALAALFFNKCAYCETPYAATQPVDVEHFRPKGEVAEDKEHPGYYWLAASWENLFPSCIDFNRERTQQLGGD